MSVLRLAAATAFFLGTLCPVGTHALAHALSSTHVHSHDDGTVHAHEHETEGHHEPAVIHTDDAPRIAASGAKLVPGPRVELPAPARPAPALTVAQEHVPAATLDPPLARFRSPVVPSSAGRAPPA